MAIDQKWAEQSRQRWDISQQMEAHYAAERAEKQAEQEAFMAQVQARKERIASHVSHSFAQRARDDMSPAQLAALREEIQQEAFAKERPPAPPTLDELYRAERAAELQAQADAEAARIAALSPRDIWMSTLSFQERERISKWEQINRMEYPMPSALQPSK